MGMQVVCNNIPAEVQAKAIAMREDGHKVKAIQQACGLNHSQTWLILNRATAEAEGTVVDTSGMDQATIASTIGQLREAGDSWGWISVKLDIPESRVRKLFAEATGKHSEGLRIGRGGRHLFNDPTLYEADPKAGVAVDASEPVVHPVYASKALEVGLVQHEFSELKAMAEELGVDTTKLNSKVKLVKAIVEFKRLATMEDGEAV